MSTTSDQGNLSFVEQFKDRVRQMNEDAAEVTRELGLPEEAQNTVLRALYGPGSRSLAPSTESLITIIRDTAGRAKAAVVSGVRSLRPAIETRIADLVAASGSPRPALEPRGGDRDAMKESFRILQSGGHEGADSTQYPLTWGTVRIDDRSVQVVAFSRPGGGLVISVGPAVEDEVIAREGSQRAGIWPRQQSRPPRSRGWVLTLTLQDGHAFRTRTGSRGEGAFPEVLFDEAILQKAELRLEPSEEGP